jgi:hypothetical protein
MQERKRERVCRGGIATWGPIVRKSAHPFLWKSLKLVGNVFSLRGAITGDPIKLDSGGHCEDD